MELDLEPGVHESGERRVVPGEPAARSRLGRTLGARSGTPAASVVLFATGAVLTFMQTPLWWFGGSMLLAAIVLGVRAFGAEGARARAWLARPRRLLGRELRLSAFGVDLACAAAVAGVATRMMESVLGGARPVGHLHTLNYFRAWLLHHDFLARGAWLGFSQRWFAGFPVNYLSPPGAALWVNAVYALSLGALDFGQAYAVAFWFAHVFSGLSLYRFGRLVGGPAVGVVAAVLSLTDLAGDQMGGWSYSADYGAWPEALSLSFALMALCSLPAIAESRRLRPLAAFGAWMGLAILTHPIQLALLPIALGAAALAAAFSDGVRAATAAFRMLLAAGLALLVACAFLVPFFGASEDARAAGALWDSAYELGKGVLSLRVLPGTLGYVVAFGALALAIALRTRRFAAMLAALLALAIPAVGNATFLDELHLTSGALSRVQWTRLAATVKPFWFVLAAYFVVAAVAQGRALVLDAGERVRRSSNARAALLAATVGLLTLPVLVPMWQAFWISHVRKTLVTELDRPALRDRQALVKWLEANLPKGGFYRVGIVTGDDLDLMDLGTLIDRPFYRRGPTPGVDFLYQVQDRTPAILDAINLRFAISKPALPAELFEPLSSFGPYTVYRYKRYSPRPYRFVQGGGQVSMERFGAEEIALRVAPGSHGKLQLGVSYFSRFRAYRDGARVPITLTYLRDAPRQTGFITLDAVPGHYRVVFERTFADRAALPLSAVGLLLCAALALADRKQRPRWLLLGLSRAEDALDRLSQPAAARARLVMLGAASVAVVGLIAGFGGMRPALQRPGAGSAGRVRYDFLENLGRASADIDYRESNQPCERQGERFVCRDEQGELDNERYVASSPAAIGDDAMVRCIRARPERNALLSIAFPDVPVADAIAGYFGIERSGRSPSKQRPVDLRVLLDDQVIFQGSTSSDDARQWFSIPTPGAANRRATVTFQVSADDVVRRHFCFYAQALDLR
jgi:hypothetical protein